MRPRPSLAACVSLALLTAVVLSACSTTANISDVWMALDADGARRRNVFFTDSVAIHCLAQAGIGRPNVTIEAYIHQIRAYDFTKPAGPEGGFFATDRYLGYTEIRPDVKKDGPVQLDLALERVGPDGKPKDDAPYVAGSYVCEVALDGDIQKTAGFNIDFPPCPPAFIVPGGPCLGFYPEGTRCPKYGEKSADPNKCSCSGPKGWECDPG